MTSATGTRATRTPSRRPTRGRRRAQPLTIHQRRAALLAGSTLLVLAPLGSWAVSLLEEVGPGGSTTGAGLAFLTVAALDVVAACGLYRLLRDRVPAPAHAAVVSRVGYAVLLAWAAALLVAHGGTGVAEFRADRADALLVFGLHLLIVAGAMWRARLAPRLVSLATGAAGVAYLLDGALERLTDVGWRGAAVPFMLGEVVLATWLVWLGRPLPLGADRG